MTREQLKQSPPVPNPPVRHGARRSPEDEALAFLRSNRDTHTRWAEYFEQNPEVEAEYLATGVWEGAADQRRLEREYNAAIATFERLASAALTRTAEPREDVVERDMRDMLLADNKRMRSAGGKLAEAAIYTVHKYDGLHRLSLAVAEWSKAVADEGHRAALSASLQGEMQPRGDKSR